MCSTCVLGILPNNIIITLNERKKRKNRICFHVRKEEDQTILYYSDGIYYACARR